MQEMQRMMTQEQYLTAADVTRLLRIDKSTVYRMAEDGRLFAIKVGRQWRFPADQLERALGVEAQPSLPSGIDRHRAAAVTGLYADLFGVMAVVTDVDGNPVTPVFNPSPYFEAISTDPAAVEACIGEWRAHAVDPELRAVLQPSRFGFLCARAYLREGFELSGMVIAGGIAPASWPPGPEAFAAMTTGTGIDAQALASAAATVPQLDESAAEAMLDGLQTLAYHLSTARSTS
jgi:excisionase family DNA binding protein